MALDTDSFHQPSGVLCNFYIWCQLYTEQASLFMVNLSFLRQRNALNLDINVLGQSLDGDTAAGRLVGEPLGVLLVHGLV